MNNPTRFDVAKVLSAADMPDLQWPKDAAEIPDWIYTDRRVFDLEVQKVFMGRNWNYVALEVEIPEPESYIRSYIGNIPIVVTRDEAGQVRAFEIGRASCRERMEDEGA